MRRKWTGNTYGDADGRVRGWIVPEGDGWWQCRVGDVDTGVNPIGFVKGKADARKAVEVAVESRAKVQP